VSMKALAAAIMSAAVAEQVTLPNALGVGDFGLGVNAEVTASINSNKSYSISGVNAGVVAAGTWLIPASADAGDYEIEFHQNSGDAVTGTLDSWLALSSNRSISLTRTVAGTSTAEIRIRIRRASDSVVVKTVVWYLDASRES
jgi:FlaG/FlaF family flagellin (archaellin)